ncbi:hypothetical protein A7979_09940 [Rothia nasimurium]|uniref:Uncharacterized protein n=1 Tax=Rothia nasimurium TaxID=85336 RepID=A0A1Y1RST2_9MICC|nr:hypothetical protein A7979_09940 [Rothia nasimurium]
MRSQPYFGMLIEQIYPNFLNKRLIEKIRRNCLNKNTSQDAAVLTLTCNSTKQSTVYRDCEFFERSEKLSELER